MADKQQIIIVPTDFSEQAATAIQHAATIAKVAGDEIRLIHVVNSDTRSMLKKAGESLEDLTKKMVDEVANIERTYGVKAGYHLREGSIFTTIGEVAEEIGARLMVMGTHGVVGMQHVTGAWAVRVITSSTVPTIIVQKKKAGPAGYKTIVFPIDGSKETKQKVIHTISMAKHFDSDVLLFGSYESDEFIENAKKNNIVWAENMLKKNGVRYTVDQATKSGGDHTKQSIKFASEKSADLIVILTDVSEVSVKNFVLGADHERIINNDAQIPTLCINPIADLYRIPNVMFL
jgi:nucleotide-binding universal stress UspA family protein